MQVRNAERRTAGGEPSLCGLLLHYPKLLFSNCSKGASMGIAKDIINVDHPGYGWLEIQDSDGRSWTFVRGPQAPSSETVHVNLAPPASGFPPKLLLAADGHAFLRQDGLGLPMKAIVRIESQGPSLGLPVMGAWGGEMFEFVQRQ
jgi:hypothetical protein